MVNQALTFLLETILGLFSLALLLRFYLQLLRVSFRNPLGQFIVALTDWMVRPARRVIPGLWGTDLSTLVLAWFTELVSLFAVLWLKGYALESAAAIALAGLGLLAAVKVIKVSLYILMVAVFAQAILSWTNPYSPVMPLLNSLTRPFLRIFQKRIPPVGNVDLTPLIVLIICQLLLILPVAWVEVTVSRLF